MNLNNLILAVTPLSKRICLGRPNKACNNTDKWQPFGVIIDDPKDLYPIDERYDER